MSWGNWQPPRHQLPGVISAPPLQSAVLPTPINAAPAIVPPTAAMPVGMQYSSDQWAQMQQQNWQQWAQWQQQYTQWHQQYGAEYQKSMGALATVNPPPTAGVLPPSAGVPPPSGGVPPPPPNENKPPPPPPPDDANRSGHYNTYNSAPNMGVPPPNWQNPNNKRPLLQTPDHEANKRQMTEQWNRGMQPKPAQPQVAPNLEELSEAEKKFDKEFAAWEAQFNKWKDQNANHPDKTQYAEYEKKWESWRNSLLDRREQMRKKRLAVQASAAAKEAKPPVVLQPVKPQENIFSKPPPTHNNDPLGFKPPKNEPLDFKPPNNEPLDFKPPTSKSYISQQQQENIGNDFLKSASPAPGGIPGLDLVKDGNVDVNYEDEVVEEPNNEAENPPVNKGPDLDAISKGINTILGDPKLLNILSRVSQNQNLASASIASMPPRNVPPQTSPYQQQPQSNPQNIPYQQPPPQSNFQNIPHQQQSNPPISPYQQPPPHQQSNPSIGPYKQPPPQQQFNPSQQQFNPPQQQFNPPPQQQFNPRAQQQFNPPPQQQFNPMQQQSNPPSLLTLSVKPPSNINNYNDYSEQQYSEPINNFDDQTRTSFTNGPNDQDMGYTNNSSNNSNYGKYDDRRSNRYDDSLNGQSNFRNSNNGPGFSNANYGGNNYNNRSYEDDSGYKQNDDYNDEPPYDNQEEPWQEDEEYDKYHDMFNEEQAANVMRENQAANVMRENQAANVMRENQGPNVLRENQAFNIMNENLNIAPPEIEPEGDEFVPQLLIDYDHKSLKEPEPEVSLTITRMFDYRHKPVNRIPYPDRPIWLSSTLRNIQQFDPLGASRFSSDLGFDRTDRRNNQDFNRYSRERFPSAENRMDWSDNRDSFNRERDYAQNRDNNRQNLSRTKPETTRPLELEELSDDEFNDDKNEENEAPLKFSPPAHKERSLSIEPPAGINSGKNNYSLNPGRNNSENPARHIFSKTPARNNPPNSAANSAIFSQNTTLDELINPPGRYNRPNRIVIILRGPPGSGKTYLAKLIKDREVEHGGSAPRILSLDDYFMVEHEKQIVEDGKFVRVKEMVYEYEEGMEESYRLSLVKAFKKTITDGYFPFVIVDNINEKVKNFGEMWSFAKQNGFQVYICQLDLDPDLCMKRNIHHRSESYIEDCIASWEPTPSHHPLLDPTSFLQSVSLIQEVEMEEVEQDIQEETHENAESPQGQASRWDTFDCSINNLARLDGVSKPLRPSRTMEEYLQLDDGAEWDTQEKPTKPGKKRVRWADLEEQKQQRKMKALGFVVGHTNWGRMMDPNQGESALTQTKYIERRFK